MVTHADAAQELAEFIAAHAPLVVLSGAGCSTASGIPDYRDADGEWKHARPVQITDFLASESVRRRYWARSYVGWSRVAAAKPNAAHTALATLEERGFVAQLITQNVDNLHRRAGSREVIDLHGVLHTVRCIDCGGTFARQDIQRQLEGRNPDFAARAHGYAPDGDARLGAGAEQEFDVPGCSVCGGTLKPDVVFFGENVPRARVDACVTALERAGALLVVGSSLMVFSGFRFASQANAAGKPLAIVNLGKTRADALATNRYSADCGALLSDAVACLAA